MRSHRANPETTTPESKQPRATSPSQPVPGVFMQRDEVLAAACVCLSTLYNWISEGEFPAPVSLGPRRSNGYSGRAVWVREEVESWAQKKIAQARTEIATRAHRATRQPVHA